MTIKFAFFALLLILILPNTLAFDQSLFSASYLDIKTNINGTIETIQNQRSQLSELKVTYTLYPKEEYSNTYSSTASPRPSSYDPIVFVWNSLQNSYNYNVMTTTRHNHIDIVITEKTNFPQKEIPYELIQYTKPSHFIDSDNKEIREVAHSIAEGETDIIELQLKIAEFVRGEIRYDLSTLQAEAKLSASETLMAKEGVCREITLLFIAVNRALNIPARYVSGYAYTNVLDPEGQWAGHAWAEVWIDGQWVPFDVTYGEYLHISPIHIPFGKTVGAQDAKTTFEWKGNGVQVIPSNPDINVTIIRKGSQVNFGTINAAPMVENIGDNSYNLIKVEVENPNPYAIAPRISLGRTQGIEILGSEKNILLYPNEKRDVYFVVKLNDSLRQGFSYTFPIVVYAQGFNDARTEFKAALSARTYSLGYFEDYINERPKVFVEDMELECSNNPIYPVGKKSSVDCIIKNKGNVNYDSISICIDTCEYISLGIQDETNVSLSLMPELGMQMTTVKVNENGRTIIEERISYEGVLATEVSVSFVEDNNDWPSGLIVIETSSPINGTLLVKTSAGNVQKFIMSGNKIEIPITFGFAAYDSLNSNFTATVSFNDALGNRNEILVHDVSLDNNFKNSIRIIAGKIARLFS